MPGLTHAALIAVATLLALAPVAAAQQRPVAEDRTLAQRIDRAQAVADAPKTLTTGHVDIGPRFLDGRWTLMIHDDTAKATGGPSVWRHVDRTVLRVGDAARVRAPDDPQYDFLHASPGTPVYVLPQTQDPDVVWVGLNTQDPKVMDTIDRGVTMTLTGVQGPGTLVVFLQSGSFSEPKVLWDSTAEPHPVWVDINTHTHANWVFSKPGIYLVQITVIAELLNGATVTDTRQLRFAIGSRTDADQAFAATWKNVRSAPLLQPDAPGATAARPDDPAGHSAAWAVAALALAGAALACGGTLVAVRGGGAKRRAREAMPSASRPVDERPSDGRR